MRKRRAEVFVDLKRDGWRVIVNESTKPPSLAQPFRTYAEAERAGRELARSLGGRFTGDSGWENARAGRRAEARSARGRDASPPRTFPLPGGYRLGTRPNPFASLGEETPASLSLRSGRTRPRSLGPFGASSAELEWWVFRPDRPSVWYGSGSSRSTADAQRAALEALSVTLARETPSRPRPRSKPRQLPPRATLRRLSTGRDSRLALASLGPYTGTLVAQREFIRQKIPILIDEGYPQRQAIAIAYSMAKVPPRPGDRARGRRDPRRTEAQFVVQVYETAPSDWLPEGEFAGAGWYDVDTYRSRQSAEKAASSLKRDGFRARINAIRGRRQRTGRDSYSYESESETTSEEDDRRGRVRRRPPRRDVDPRRVAYEAGRRVGRYERVARVDPAAQVEVRTALDDLAALERESGISPFELRRAFESGRGRQHTQLAAWRRDRNRDPGVERACAVASRLPHAPGGPIVVEALFRGSPGHRLDAELPARAGLAEDGAGTDLSSGLRDMTWSFTSVRDAEEVARRLRGARGVRVTVNDTRRRRIA